MNIFCDEYVINVYITNGSYAKTLGYYKNMEKQKNNKNKNDNIITNNSSWYKTFIIIIILILLVICVLFMGIYIYKNKKNRKKKANELDDEYNYEPKFDLNYDNNNNLIGDDKIIN